MEDAKFMMTEDKEKVVKQFEKFLESDCAETKFTKALYEHLYLHCGFIAHYDINGFYNTYFNGDKKDFKNFCENFLENDEGYGELCKPMSNVWCYDMIDINMELSKILLKYYNKILAKTSQETKRRAILQIKILMSENNLTIADMED